MKYLYIHKMIWFLLIVSWTLFEAIIISIYYILYVLWNFKLPKNVWSSWHTYSEYAADTSSCPPKIDLKLTSDATILVTIKRRYKII